jgi:hypothetical protein
VTWPLGSNIESKLAAHDCAGSSLIGAEIGGGGRLHEMVVAVAWSAFHADIAVDSFEKQAR